jgi:phosphotriesterase-related protein
MGKQVNTVLGPVDADSLGKTLMHEHFIFSFPGYATDLTLAPYDYAGALEKGIAVANRAKFHGVKTIVDVTPNECARDPLLLKEISEKTGINIICVTGCYFESSGAPAYWNFRALLGDAVQEIQDMFVAEYTQGIADTGIKAGLIKIGSSKGVITDYEKMVFKAAARASRETGALIMTHTERGTMGVEQADLLIAEGADPERIIIGHMCGATDIRYELDVLQRGVNIGFDRWGYESPLWGTPLDTDREAMMMALFARGHIEKMFFSHDSVNFGRSRPPKVKPAGPPPDSPVNVGRLFEVLIPRFKALGVTEAQMEQILVKNPARIFNL